MISCGKSRAGKSIAAITLVGISSLVAAPTNQRVWTSIQGGKITAIAQGTDDDDVLLEREDGRLARVPITRLSDDDRAFLARHFSQSSEFDGTASPESGQVVEDIEAGNLGNIFAYIPSSALPDTKLPAICYIDQRRTQVKSLDRLKQGAETVGWPVVMSDTMKGNVMKQFAPKLSEGWVEAMQRELPVDVDRLFGASYGSGVDALVLMHKKFGKFDGIITVCGALDGRVGGLPVCYSMVGIDTPSRRSISAYFGKKAPRGSRLRLTDKGRKNADSNDFEDAMVFLAAHHYSNDGISKSAEANAFVTRALVRVDTISSDDPERALMWLDSLCETHTSPTLRKQITDTAKSIETIETRRYVDGFAIMQKFAVNHLADAGPSTDEESREKLTKKLDQLRDKLKGTKWIDVINAFE